MKNITYITLVFLFSAFCSAYAQQVVKLTLPTPCLASPIKTIELRQFTVYPNPNNGQFTVRVAEQNSFEKSELTITDSSGRKILIQPIPADAFEVPVSLNSIASGLYFVSVKGKSTTWQGKILIE